LPKPAVLFQAVLPLLSLAVSILVYAWLFDWQLSLGIILLLFIHEIGHYLVIRAKGMPASLPVFIPLLGAYVVMRRMPASVRDEAEIAIAGPALGALSGIACYLLFQVTQEPSLLILAQLAFLLNLINMVPVAPLDGGRIVGAISRWIWLIGLALIAIGFFYLNSPVIRIVLLILGWLGFVQLRARFSGTDLDASYYRISLVLRSYITLLYVGLVVALVLGFLATEQTIHSLHPLFTITPR
jgi:Zn-dependent protease